MLLSQAHSSQLLGVEALEDYMSSLGLCVVALMQDVGQFFKCEDAAPVGLANRL